MASLIFQDAVVSIKGVDLSDHVRQVQIDYTSELQDATVMGSNTRNSKAGLFDWTITLTLLQDFAASQTDITVFSLVGSSGVELEIQATTSSVSATNPRYTGQGTLETYPIFANSVGEIAETALVFRPAGSGTTPDLARTTSS